MKMFLQPTVILAVALMAIIVMMILPMPAWVLDLGLAASFGLAILMFTTTLFLERPLDFSAFPTILLASLMLRLSLNVSSTKLIIGEGHTGTGAAGNVIEGFANFVMGGSVYLGLVVFCVLLIVNFIVITKGATRMAEVGARFALDGMPGKQLAIDSDMSAGAIDHTEAKSRREREQAETTFFGSLDGASKFVKGDAVAGLLITMLNLVMGLIIGVAAHGMPMGLAFETYAILTVGDGLVTQIPAVIISIATALLLARGGTSGATDIAMVEQIGRHPSAIATVGVLMVFFALVPGMPFIPFMLGAAALLAAAYYFKRKLDLTPEITAPISIERVPEKSMGDILDLDEIHVEFSPDLVMMALDPTTGLETRIANMRSHVASSFGLVLPEIRLTDDASLASGVYRIRIHGVVKAEDKLLPDSVLALLPPDAPNAIEGETVKEPVYGAPAKWMARKYKEDAALAGCTVVTPPEILATHLLEVIKGNFGRLLSLRGLRRILDEFTNLSDAKRNEANRKILDELIPEKVSLETLLQVLRLLLEEQISIRNLPVILESIAEGRSIHSTAEGLCEHTRQRLGAQLFAELKREDGSLPLIQLSPDWEDVFSKYSKSETQPSDVSLPPEDYTRLAEGLTEKLTHLNENGVFPAVVTSVLRRRFIRLLLANRGINTSVFSYEEIASDSRPAIVGMVAA
ncbi:flagellar biosynthesis protein FlhA [Litoreibacter halocynthiae]|uniref:Flagellar biosynthesis protein FlhA n=1 Tax=Litoreibacter halocynthiae TaxID=1242689 RepID=A0A4R7LE16_9RHOB|nr:flagellar biosynthesis protein FlhA [Litoreibacter halocynthiae]TDT73863.1 flagellar biosynthesis protein FlhA [Litoreibacter halocynthiae]